MVHNLPPPQDNQGIKISGRVFPEGILTLQADLDSSPITTKGTFRIDLNKNPDFRNVDLKGTVHIFIDNNRQFSGLIKKYYTIDEFGVLDLQDITLRLEYESLAAETINLEHIDVFALLTQSSGIVFIPPSNEPYDDSEREFVIIIPVKNLSISENFKIGNVEFYHDFKNIDDSFVRKSKTGKENHEWNNNKTRARTIVKARNFFNAITTGYSVISTAIDVIAFRADFSFPSIEIDSHRYDMEYHYQTLLSKVKIPTFVYCRENNTDFVVFFDIETIRETVLTLNSNPQKFFNEVKILCDNLLQKTSLSPTEKNLLQVLHWLRKAIQEGDDKDKFLDLWIAFEFLISGEKSKKGFSADDKNKFIDIITRSDFKPSEKEAIIKIVSNSINNPTLMVKFDQLVNKLKISFSIEEREFLNEFYGKRNAIVHGKKGLEISDDELDKMRTIIEKIFIGKMNALK